MNQICILTHIFPARSETFILEHVLGLARRGYDVTVIARVCGEGIVASEMAELDRAGIRRVYVSTHRSRSLRAIKSLVAVTRHPALLVPFLRPKPWTRAQLLTALNTLRVIRQTAPDVLHIHFGTNAARLELISSYLVDGLPPAVVTWHGYDANAMPRVLGAGVYERLFASSMRHTVGSGFIRNRLLGLGARTDSISIVPMGIDLEKFSYRERVLAPDAPLNILSVGRLDEVKGHALLIEAVRRLKTHGLVLNLRIVGDGPLREKLQAQIAEAGLIDCVTLVGAVPSESVVDEMHGAHVFVLTGAETGSGKVESQGVVFAEAQATGIPVVACDVGGVKDSIVDGETGLLCPSGDIESVVDAIRSFSTDRTRIRDFGRLGRKFVEEKFSRAMMLDRFEELYRTLRTPK